jgi:hypothetical protein
MTGRMRALTVAVACTAAGLAGLAHGAVAAPPSPQWLFTGHSDVPFEYFQGITSDNKKNLYFDGLFVGLYRTDLDLNEEARNPYVIPPQVVNGTGYTHIGDITWDRREGGRVLLPLECLFAFFCTNGPTGAIGVADPDTLQWRYHVELDPAFIDKAMWAETSPNGKLLWTSSGSGKDLLAYDMDDISPQNAWPDGPKLKPVIRFVNAVPPSGITGATFYKHRLLLAGARGSAFQVWSIDTSDGSRELVLDRTVVGESEGLDIVKAMGGVLHWQVTPMQTGGLPPTFGTGHSAVMHFVPDRGGIGPQH